MTTTEATLRDAAEQARNFTNRIAHGCWGNGYITEAKEIAHRLAVALSQPSPASSPVGEEPKCKYCNDTGWTLGNGTIREGCLNCDMQIRSLSPSSGEPASVAVEADIMIGEFIARWEEAADGVMMDADVAEALAREFKRMRGLIYCPGVLRCAKCDFRLIKTTLTPSGAFANEEPDTCPNCNVPMWRVTWQDEAKEAYKVAESQMDRALAAEAALSKPTPVEAGLREDNRKMRQALDLISTWSPNTGGRLFPVATAQAAIAALSETPPPPSLEAP